MGATWRRACADDLSRPFLRNMVRAIVGTMVDVGTGKIKPEDIHDIIEKKNRNAAGTSAPAHGLYLVDVGYNFDN